VHRAAANVTARLSTIDPLVFPVPANISREDAKSVTAAASVAVQAAAAQAAGRVWHWDGGFGFHGGAIHWNPNKSDPKTNQGESGIH
jgi:hypothetical protein